MPDYPKAYIMDRALKTLQCMKYIATHAPTWTWPEITPANFEIKYDACDALGETASDEAADTTGERGARDQKLESLRNKGRAFLKFGKLNYRNNPAKLRLLKPLSAKSETVAGTLREALRIESAWEEVDAAYVPETGNTLAAFSTLRGECKTEHEDVAKEASEESGAGGSHRVALNDLYRVSVDWYQEAIRRFGPETAHGMLIRSQIPTNSAAENLPPQPIVTPAFDPNTMTVTLTIVCFGADEFEVSRQFEGEPDPVIVAEHAPADADGETDFADVVPQFGNYTYILTPKNNDGPGPASAPLLVNAV